MSTLNLKNIKSMRYNEGIQNKKLTVSDIAKVEFTKEGLGLFQKATIYLNDGNHIDIQQSNNEHWKGLSVTIIEY